MLSSRGGAAPPAAASLTSPDRRPSGETEDSNLQRTHVSMDQVMELESGAAASLPGTAADQKVKPETLPCSATYRPQLPHEQPSRFLTGHMTSYLSSMLMLARILNATPHTDVVNVV